LQYIRSYVNSSWVFKTASAFSFGFALDSVKGSIQSADYVTLCHEQHAARELRVEEVYFTYLHVPCRQGLLHIFLFHKSREFLQTFAFHKERDCLHNLIFHKDTNYVHTFMVHKDGDFLHIFMFQKYRDFFAHMRSYHTLNTKPCILENLEGYYSGNNNVPMFIVRTSSFLTSCLFSFQLELNFTWYLRNGSLYILQS
jgi:hypothetical protein